MVSGSQVESCRAGAGIRYTFDGGKADRGVGDGQTRAGNATQQLMIRGTLDRLHLGDLLQWLQMGALSGRLTLIQDRHERSLDFIDGRVVYASSVHPAERLATWFAAEKLLEAKKLQYLLGLSLLRRTLFTQLVIEDGGVAEHDLRASLTRLGEKIVCSLLIARELDFVFDPGYPVQDLLNLSMDVDPHSLLMEAARQSDELSVDRVKDIDEPLPHQGEAFDRFFWDLIREGVAGDDLLDGEQIVELYQLVRDIMRTLAQWLASSPGLIPLPEVQAERIRQYTEDSESVQLSGLPHAAWNQMVLCNALRSNSTPKPRGLGELEATGPQLNLWREMVDGEKWQRPDAGRLDNFTREEADLWARASAAAAGALGVDPETARLAAHLLTVPCDLVLWVLSTLAVPHLQLRLTLLRELPKRLGTELAAVADFPLIFRNLLAGEDQTSLGVCLHLARQFLQSKNLWPDPLGGDLDLVLKIVSEVEVTEALARIEKTLDS